MNGPSIISHGSRIRTIFLAGLALVLAIGFLLPDAFSQDESVPVRYGRLARAEKLWSGPGPNYKVVRRAEQGLLVKVVGEVVKEVEEEDDYYRIFVPDGYDCYISALYLNVGADSVGVVTGNRVALRSIPNPKADFPLIRVDKGQRLKVWEKVGDWYRCLAPEHAHVYVIQDSLTLVAADAQVLADYQKLLESRQEIWKAHQEEVKAELDRTLEKRQNQIRFQELEKSAGEGFKGRDLAKVLAEYEAIIAQTDSEANRKVAEVRVDAIKALMDRDKSIKDLEERSRDWAAERKKLEREVKEAAENQVQAVPESHEGPGKGRQVTTVGFVDAKGPETVLRGGKSRLDLLYRISCPDGRYILGDFDERRVRIIGRLSESGGTEEKAMILVERIELL